MSYHTTPIGASPSRGIILERPRAHFMSVGEKVFLFQKDTGQLGAWWGKIGPMGRKAGWFKEEGPGSPAATFPARAPSTGVCPSSRRNHDTANARAYVAVFILHSLLEIVLGAPSLWLKESGVRHASGGGSAGGGSGGSSPRPAEAKTEH